MNVLITGTSEGIGRACAEVFLQKGHRVFGVDIQPSTIEHPMYHHFVADVSDYETLPHPPYPVDILINNAGIQQGDVIGVNLQGTINCTKKYALSNNYIKSILMVASVSAHNGAEFPEYCASKGGMISYMRAVAKHVAHRGATCNSISPGGVITGLNSPVIHDSALWEQVMNETPLGKWATAEEIAEWCYFLTVNNTSMSGQDVLIDNMEMLNHTFVWPEAE